LCGNALFKQLYLAWKKQKKAQNDQNESLVKPKWLAFTKNHPYSNYRRCGMREHTFQRFINYLALFQLIKVNSKSIRITGASASNGPSIR